MFQEFFIVILLCLIGTWLARRLILMIPREHCVYFDNASILLQSGFHVNWSFIRRRPTEVYWLRHVWDPRENTTKPSIHHSIYIPLKQVEHHIIVEGTKQCPLKLHMTFVSQVTDVDALFSHSSNDDKWWRAEDHVKNKVRSLLMREIKDDMTVSQILHMIHNGRLGDIIERRQIKGGGDNDDNGGGGAAAAALKGMKIGDVRIVETDFPEAIVNAYWKGELAKIQIEMNINTMSMMKMYDDAIFQQKMNREAKFMKEAMDMCGHDNKLMAIQWRQAAGTPFGLIASSDYASSRIEQVEESEEEEEEEKSNN